MAERIEIDITIIFHGGKVTKVSQYFENANQYMQDFLDKIKYIGNNSNFILQLNKLTNSQSPNNGVVYINLGEVQYLEVNQII